MMKKTSLFALGVAAILAFPMLATSSQAAPVTPALAGVADTVQHSNGGVEQIRFRRRGFGFKRGFRRGFRSHHRGFRGHRRGFKTKRFYRSRFHHKFYKRGFGFHRGFGHHGFGGRFY